MTDYGDQIALASGFDTQNAEAVLGIVERDAVDQPGQDFCLRACPRCCPHQVMMEIKVVGRYRHQAGEEAWCETATAASVLELYLGSTRILRATWRGTPAESLGRENLAKPLDRAQHLLLRKPRPLAAHDEVIDTEKLTISRDLLLHRCLVADDEPIAREILE